MAGAIIDSWATSGPYPVTTLDPSYQAIVGYLDSCGFYFRVLDDQGAEVDGQGLDGELRHLTSLLDGSWVYVDWRRESALIAELRQHDPALVSKHPGVLRLIAA